MQKNLQRMKFKLSRSTRQTCTIKRIFERFHLKKVDLACGCRKENDPTIHVFSECVLSRRREAKDSFRSSQELRSA